MLKEIGPSSLSCRLTFNIEDKGEMVLTHADVHVELSYCTHVHGSVEYYSVTDYAQRCNRLYRGVTDRYRGVKDCTEVSDMYRGVTDMYRGVPLNRLLYAQRCNIPNSCGRYRKRLASLCSWSEGLLKAIHTLTGFSMAML